MKRIGTFILIFSFIFSFSKIQKIDAEFLPNFVPEKNYLYRSILGREITENEFLNFSSFKIEIEKLISSNEYNSRIEDFVREVYKFLLKREPDEIGLKFWKTRGPLELFFGIVSSEEYRNFHPDEVFEGSEFSEVNIFNISNVDLEICNSIENRDKYDKNQINLIFRMILGREVSAREFAKICTSQVGVEDLIKILISSEVYDTRVRSFVSKMYEFLLKRAPDEIGVNFWATRFPLELFFGIKNSAEYKLLPFEKNKVLKVIDGDTVELSDTSRVRFIGIDTPEISYDPSVQTECYAINAKEATASLMMEKSVFLERDVSETDKYGRKLRYAYLWDGKNYVMMLNEWLVRYGFAKSADYPPDTKFANKFHDAESWAKLEKRGLWGRCFLTYDGNEGVDVNKYECSYDKYNCYDKTLSDGTVIKGFKIQSDAQKVFDYCKQISGKDVHGLDGSNKNDIACESLPKELKI
ncbi:MAG: hypothetical protein Fur0024_1830 [Patescibacteria group bacterium]